MFKLVLSKKELDKLQNIVKKCHNIIRRYISGKGSGTGDLSLYTRSSIDIKLVDELSHG